MNSFLGGLEFFSMNIVYWALVHLQYRGTPAYNYTDFWQSSAAVAIIFLIAICIYSLVRVIFNPLGGLYMFKRVLVAAILSHAYMNNIYLVPLILLETVFLIARYIIEKPEKRKEKVFLWLEYFVWVMCYLLLFLCGDPGVNTIILSIVVFIAIVVLSYDLTDVYL